MTSLTRSCGTYWWCLAALGDQKHSEHEMYREWMPVGYDPARFDLGEINEALAQLGTGALQR